MPRTRNNIERRRNSLSDSDLDNISLRMENASLKAFEKHRSEDHAPLQEQMNKLFKFKNQTLAIGGFVITLGTLAWGEIKGLFHHGG